MLDGGTQGHTRGDCAVGTADGAQRRSCAERLDAGARRRRRRPGRCYEPVLQVAEIMLTLVTVNVPPLAALELVLALGLALDGDDADEDELPGAEELSMRPVTITW